MSKEEFIAEHLRTCTASRAKKYDATKSGAAVHSLAYSRRKCAKNIWRKMQRCEKDSQLRTCSIPGTMA
jgi:hypothetical protein